MKRIREININTLDFWNGEWAKREPELIERFSIIAEFLRRAGAKKILDIGCGDGLAYTHIKQKYGCDYYGTDFSDTAIEKAKATHPDAHYALADCYAQPFDDASFDAVLCQEVFEHIDEPQRLAKEMMRLARPGGTIIVSTPFEDFLNTCEEHVWSYTRQDIRDLFNGCKVQFLESDTIYPDIIFAVITKPI